MPLRIAVTADLHHGTRHVAGQKATYKLVQRLTEHPPDLLVLAGDIGAGDDFERALQLFRHLPCRKAAVPGNHDIWVRTHDPRGNSLDLYERVLPELCRKHGFEYLDQAPILLPEAGLAIVGTMNWYDYSWDHDRLREATADWQFRLETKRFTRGMHNDANFVRWPYTDQSFTDQVVGRLTSDLDRVFTQVSHALVVAHHPPLRGMLYPAQEPLSLDALLWRAFSGNERVEAELTRRADRIPFVFCGHTHRARHCTVGPMQGINIGGDYHFKRLVWLDWPARQITEEEFHAD